MLKFIGTAILKIVIGLLGIVLVLYAWYHMAPMVVDLLDFNLRMVKWVCAFLPKPYGAMVESTLRATLAIDKVLLFAEGTGLVKGVLLLLKLAYVRNREQILLSRR